MRRSLGILATLAVIFSFIPILPFVPVEVAQGATINVVCTGSNDNVAIQNAITAASAGDTINISQGGGVSYCDIQFPLLVTKALTLQGQGMDVTYLKGREVINVNAAVSAAQSKAASAKAGAQAKGSANAASVKAAADAKASAASSAAASASSASAAPNRGTPGDKAGTTSAKKPKTANTEHVHHHHNGGAQSARITTSALNRGSGGGTIPSPDKSAADKMYASFLNLWGSGSGQASAAGDRASAAVSTTTGPGIGVFSSLPGRVTIQNFTITGFNNTGADAAGGAIFVGMNTPVTVTNNAIRLNAATRGGGVAILMEDSTLNGNAAIIVSNNTITQNVAAFTGTGTPDPTSNVEAGGGVWTFTETDNLQITGNSITNNVSNAAGGGLSIGRVAKNFQMLNNTCQANVAGDGSSNSDSYGGCIRLWGDIANPGNSNGGVVTGNQIIQNTSYYQGAGFALGVGNANWTFTGNTFQDNFADDDGGGLFIDDNTFHSTITGNTFQGNLTYGWGAGLSIGAAGSTCGSPTQISNNVFKFNQAYDDQGGGAWFGTNNSCMQLGGNTWAQNASYYGGGAFTFDDEGEDSSITNGQSSQSVTITNDFFTGNSTYDDPGGAILFYNPMPDLTISGSTFNGNNSYYYGGAIAFYDYDSPRVTVQNSAFINNVSGDDYGGAIYFDNVMDNLKILSSLFQGNSAPAGYYGGALYFDDHSTGMLFLNNQFVGNYAGEYGGAIYFSYPGDNTTITGTGSPGTCTAVTAYSSTSAPPFAPGQAPACSLFAGNKSGEYAGAIYFDDTTTNLLLQNTLFQSNTAYYYGGALCFVGSTADGMRITNNVFKGNSSTGYPGAVYLSLGSNAAGTPPRLDHNIFDGNKGEETGALEVVTTSTNLSIDHNTFTNNSAYDYGGAVEIDSSGTGTIFAYNLLKNNTAGGYGGGLVVFGPVVGLDVYNNVFERNTARQYGGNLYVNCTSCDNATNYMNFDNNTFAFGSAPLAGGVYITSSDDSDSNGLADGISFWNNISTLNLSGDFYAPLTSVPVRAYNSIIGTTADNGFCDALDSCLLGTSPQFISASGDNFHIGASSPAVNLGSPTNPTGAGLSTVAAPTDDCSEPPAANDCGLTATPGPRVGRPDAGAYEAQGQSPTAPTPTFAPTRTATLVGGVTATPSNTPAATVTINFTATVTTTRTSTRTATGTATSSPTATIFTLTPTATTCVPGPFVDCGTPTPGTPVVTSTSTTGPSATPTNTGAPTATRTSTATNTVVAGATATPTLGHR